MTSLKEIDNGTLSTDPEVPNARVLVTHVLGHKWVTLCCADTVCLLRNHPEVKEVKALKIYRGDIDLEGEHNPVQF